MLAIFMNTVKKLKSSIRERILRKQRNLDLHMAVLSGSIRRVK